MLLLRKSKQERSQLADTSAIYSSKLTVTDTNGQDSTFSEITGFGNSDREPSIFPTSRPQTSLGTPTVPPRSNKRPAMRFRAASLEFNILELNKGNISLTSSSLQVTDPHEVYLSSEEDASISDYDESSLFELDDSDVDPIPISCEHINQCSQEVIARAISFRVAGKPQIVEINNSSAETSPSLTVASSNTSSKRSSVSDLHTSSLLDSRKSIYHTRNYAHSTSPTHIATPHTQTSSFVFNLTHEGLLRSSETPEFIAHYEPSNQTPSLSPSLSIPERSVDKELQMILPYIDSSKPPSENGSSVASKSPGRSAVAAWKRVSRNIRNTSVVKLSLGYPTGTGASKLCHRTKTPPRIIASDTEKSLSNIGASNENNSDTIENISIPHTPILKSPKSERRGIALSFWVSKEAD
ncbi:BgTH12-07392 [Blumeria graminis f. sp. triticale]|uniref:BgTH12-07392 n=1 Tax=Blumeria graminis f. sp. triticale TaxID=1689686 RepID=A0A9W4CX75_BLUGR|nr:BgTH12-07392 [Blumeria graminis f. sp. triticale]